MNQFKSIARAVALASTLAVVASTAGAAVETKYTGNCKPYAADLAGTLPKPKLQLQDEMVYKTISKAQEPMGAERWDEVITLLTPLLERTANRPGDFAMVNQWLSSAYAGKKNYGKAIEHLQKAIDSNGMTSDAQMQQARNNLLYFYVATDNHAKTIDALKTYFRWVPNPKPEIYALMGQVFMQQEKYQDAICPVYLAIKGAEEQKLPVKKMWYDMLLSSHYELKDFDGAGKVIAAEIDAYPDEPKLWLTAANIYIQQEKEADALAMLQLAYFRGFVEKQGDFMNLAGLYSNAGAPYKAAQVLEEAMKGGKVESTERNWKSIAQFWVAAREDTKALAAYGEAAKLSKEGTYFLHQGEIYAEQGKWKEAIDVFGKALEKGGIKEPGRVHLNIGIAQWELGNAKAAIPALEKAAGYEKTTKTAMQYINFINQKLRAQGQ